LSILDSKLRKINNRNLLKELEKAGDDGQQARCVRHWAYFASKTDRDKFQRALVGLGYQALEEDPPEEPSLLFA